MMGQLYIRKIGFDIKLPGFKHNLNNLVKHNLSLTMYPLIIRKTQCTGEEGCTFYD